MSDKKIKVCLVGSSGGHLDHLYILRPFWEGKERFWATFDKEDARSQLKGEKIYPVYYPSNRSLKERPDLIISAGAAPAVPFFYIGKLFGAKLIYLETFDRINKASLSGKLCYKISDLFIVQWEQMKEVFPKAVYYGSLF